MSAIKVGNWRPTPAWMFWKPRFRRPVYGDMGAGEPYIKHWEYADRPR